MRLTIPESLTQRAFRLIRNEIVEGRLDSSQRLTEEYFAKKFGISKSPIREALNRLEAEGLVHIVPRRGAFVITITVRDVEEIYEMREMLEAGAIRNFEPDEQVFAKLRRSLALARQYLKSNEKLRYIREDMAFHSIIANANSNSRLRKALENMHHQMLILRHQTYHLTSHSAVVHHREILDALERDDRKEAEKLMVSHIRAVRDRLVQHLSAETGGRNGAGSDGRMSTKASGAAAQ